MRKDKAMNANGAVQQSACPTHYRSWFLLHHLHRMSENRDRHDNCMLLLPFFPLSIWHSGT